MYAIILVAPRLGSYHCPFLKNINYFADSLFLAKKSYFSFTKFLFHNLKVCSHKCCSSPSAKQHPRKLNDFLRKEDTAGLQYLTKDISYASIHDKISNDGKSVMTTLKEKYTYTLIMGFKWVCSTFLSVLLKIHLPENLPAGRKEVSIDVFHCTLSLKFADFVTKGTYGFILSKVNKPALEGVV